jgi:hypothetical protein
MLSQVLFVIEKIMVIFFYNNIRRKKIFVLDPITTCPSTLTINQGNEESTSISDIITTIETRMSSIC